MECTKNEITEAILIFAKKYNTEKNYLAILKGYGIYSIIKEIVYDMFVNEFNYLDCSNDELNANKLIHEYCKEIKENGFIEFKKD